MPSNKKRKKPANHSARGFATTSTPSKARVVDDGKVEDSAEPIAGSEIRGRNEAGCNNPLESAVTERLQKELHELTAEELESHFEESNLQLLLEDYGEKCGKDASRQFNRITTERRVLRPQSERLEVGIWLPDEFIQEILDLLNAQMKIDNLDNESVKVLADSDISESDLLIKLWTLEKLLGQLGFKQGLIRLALQSLLRKRQSSELVIGKESIWGLDDCFDILALLCDPKDAPPYGNQSNDTRPKKNRNMEEGTRYGRYETSRNMPATVESQRPTQVLDSKAGFKIDSDEKSSAADTDSDIDESSEPETLIRKYVSLQSQILELQPCFSFHENKQSKNYNEKNIRPIREVEKLLAKIQKIRSDVLFDEDEAFTQWASVRDQYAREVAERKKYHLDKEKHVDSAEFVELSSREASFVEMRDDVEHFEMIGDLFSSLPEIASDPDTGASTLVSGAHAGQTVTIRGFEKWSGINPRRILEEACKARDAACKITFNVVSQSTFSFRHSLQIDWSMSQHMSELIHDSSIVSDVAEFNVKLQMATVSTPNVLQSESYISTVALYLIFGRSPKEEKAHLRLPPQWRDLWEEMSLFEKKHNDAADRGVLRQLQNIMAFTKSETVFPRPAAGHNAKPTILKEQSSARDEIVLKMPAVTEMNDKIAKMWSSKVSSSSYREMKRSRQNLPIWNSRDRLLNAIEDNQVVIVCGETGCGKSTQVPAFILENQLSRNRHCKVYCSEPRRISAISLARRVSEELGEQRTDVGSSKSLVGYVIRLESKITDETRLVYATTGIVMRMLERSDGLGDITHLILDEVHERSLESDFLLIVLRKLMLRRPALKVILMSATVDAGRFSHYLGGAPIMNVPGRTFPVDTKYLEDAIEITDFSLDEESARRIQDGNYSDHDDKPENVPYHSASDDLQGYSQRTRRTLASLDQYRINYDLIINLLEVLAFEKQYTKFSNAILIFLPGISEIRRLSNLIQSQRSFSQGWNICALHSTIATEEQERAFLIPLPGIRKIVLATNIAETGITIPDVTCVIDTGRHKEMRYDERRQLSRLIETFISRSNAKQRRGRAGRVQNGICFHLFTKARHDNLMLEEQTPEMLRLSLQDLVLRVKICKLGGIEETLSEALDPPSSKNIQRAINALVDAKALTAKEDLTPLGRQLARLPLDVFLGKLLVLGTFYQCLDAVLSIAAILSSKSPFSASMGSRSQADAARLGFKRGDSDLLTVYNAYSAWRKICCTTGGSEQLFCRKNNLSSQTLSNIEELKAQLMTSIVDAGFVTLDETEKSSLNKVRFYSNQRRFVEVPERYMNNNANELMLNSVIAWSFYPKLLSRDGKGWKNIVNNQHVSLHPTSVNKGLQQPFKWLSYYHIMKSSNKFYNAHETSAVESMAVVLGCGDAEFKMYAGVIVIDGNRIRFSVNTWRAMLAIKTLRSQMRQIMAQFFRKPGCEFSPDQRAWMDIWQRVFTVEKGHS